MARYILLAGTILGALSVILGAFTAHGLDTLLSAEALTTFKTGVEYQFFHSLVLILISQAISQKPKIKSFTIAGIFISAGIICFSGSLYLLALTGSESVTLITPLGGIAFLVGWGAFITGAWKS